MKKILLILTIILHSIAINNLHAQFVNIPDANFRNWLNSNGYSSCMSGNMMDTTCALIVNATKVNCQSSNIADITGIQYFDNLDTLICNSQTITSLPTIHSSLLYLDASKNFYSLTSISNFPTSLLYIDISQEYFLDSIPLLPPGLTHFDCSSNNIHTLPTLPSTLTFLHCASNPLHTLPALPSGIISLYCYYDSLTTLPPLPAALTYLDCQHNLLASLPTLPTGLGILTCNDNQVTILPTLPSNLNTLSVQYNSISSLPNVPSTLYTVHLDNNLFTSIPAFGNSLHILSCSNNLITSVPVFTSPLLISLDFSYNQVTSIPPGLSATLTGLSCKHNLLTSLPALSGNLTWLDCSNNQIATLPVLPSFLSTLRCDSTLIINLPVLPLSLDYLSIKYDQINSLPDLPDTLLELNISYTPLTCLPYIKRINNFLWTGSSLNCLPNIIQIPSSTPSASVLGLCQPSGNCPTYWNIRGNVFNDLNLDCVNNAEDNLLNIPVKLDSAGVFMQEFLTNSSGDYSFRTYNGTYSVSVDTTNLPFDVNCPVTFNHTSVITTLNSYDSLANFGLKCKTGFDLEATSIAANGSLRPGVHRYLFLNAGDAATFYGTDCATGISGNVLAVLTGLVNYVSPAPGALTPSSVSNDSITWTVADFSQINPATDFNIEIAINTSATIGDTVCIQLNTNPVVGDNNASNNHLTSCYPIVNSLDPNEKFMSPSGDIDTMQQWFTFTIYFQNTGSAPAEDIYILDTLINFLDASTFTFLSSSHNVITQLLPGKVLRFNYADINLLDSTANEPASHGYVQFKVKRKPNLPSGTVIANTSYIYFDYNPAIVTNTASATLIINLSVPENERSEFQIYPNPSQSEFMISSAKPISEVKIINPLGCLISEVKPFGRNIFLRIDNAGIYFVRVAIENKIFTRKIIIQK